MTNELFMSAVKDLEESNDVQGRRKWVGRGAQGSRTSPQFPENREKVPTSRKN